MYNTFMKRLLPFLLLPLMLLTASAGRAATVDGPVVVYDKKTDLLSIEADKASLHGVLSRIGLLSGVEFLIGQGIERPVTIRMKERPLEKGLKRMMDNLDLSYAMIYQRKEGQDPSAEPLLVTVRIVPRGREGALQGDLKPLLHVEGEAIIRAQSGDTPPADAPAEGEVPSPSEIKIVPGQQPVVLDYAERRWRDRLSSMPPDKRNALEKRMLSVEDRRKDRIEKEKLRAEERGEEQEKKRLERRADMEELKNIDPEFYEVWKKMKEGY